MHDSRSAKRSTRVRLWRYRWVVLVLAVAYAAGFVFTAELWQPTRPQGDPRPYPRFYIFYSRNQTADGILHKLYYPIYVPLNESGWCEHKWGPAYGVPHWVPLYRAAFKEGFW